MENQVKFFETRGRTGFNGAVARNLETAPVFVRAELPANRAPVKLGGRGRPRKYRLDLLEVGQFLDISVNKRGAKATAQFRNRLNGAIVNFEKRYPDRKFAIRTFKNEAIRVFRIA